MKIPTVVHSALIGTSCILSILLFSTTTLAKAELTLDREGSSHSGLNDTLETAQDLGFFQEVPLNILGYIDELNSNDIDYFQFVLSGVFSQTIFFDIDFANDLETPDTDDDDGLDAIISVYNSRRLLMGENDDVGFPADPGSAPNGDFDPFLELTLAPDTYLVAVNSFGLYTISAGSGQYCLQIRTSEGFDAPPNDCQTESVPEPALILGLLAFSSLLLLCLSGWEG